MPSRQPPQPSPHGTWAVANPISAALAGRQGKASHSADGSVARTSCQACPVWIWGPANGAAKCARVSRIGKATERRNPAPATARPVARARQSGQRCSCPLRPAHARSRSPRAASTARRGWRQRSPRSRPRRPAARPGRRSPAGCGPARTIVRSSSPWSSTSVPGAAASSRRVSGCRSIAESVRRTATTAGIGIASRPAPWPSHGFSKSASSWSDSACAELNTRGAGEQGQHRGQPCCLGLRRRFVGPRHLHGQPRAGAFLPMPRQRRRTEPAGQGHGRQERHRRDQQRQHPVRQGAPESQFIEAGRPQGKSRRGSMAGGEASVRPEARAPDAGHQRSLCVATTTVVPADSTP